MVPLLLAVILENASQRRPAMPLDSLENALRWLHQNPEPTAPVDFQTVLRQLGAHLVRGEAASDAILAACQRGACDLFPRLTGQSVFAELLTNTRRPGSSATTAIFEAFALGDAMYENWIGLPARVASPSLLAAHDRPLLRADLRERLNRLTHDGGLRLAAYTARPSLPVDGHSEGLAVFAPEAELALELVGLERITLVGSGQTGEAARALGEQEDRLTKPAPYHAAAAIAAAWTGDRRAALQWTQEIFCHVERGGPAPSLLVGSTSLPETLELAIFEDSPIGMTGGIEAARLLDLLGMRIALQCWGVTTNAEKAAALRATGAEVFRDVNSALEQALDSAGPEG
jgi:hypothetical protein